MRAVGLMHAYPFDTYGPSTGLTILLKCSAVPRNYSQILVTTSSSSVRSSWSPPYRMPSLLDKTGIQPPSNMSLKLNGGGLHPRPVQQLLAVSVGNARLLNPQLYFPNPSWSRTLYTQTTTLHPLDVVCNLMLRVSTLQPLVPDTS